MDQYSLLDPNDSSSDGRRRLIDWLRLRRAYGPGPMQAVAAWRAHRHPGAAARAAGRPLPDVSDDLRCLARCGVRVWPIDHPDFPSRLAQLADAPPLLFVRGDPGCLAAGGRCVAIVGGRAASEYGLEVARRLAAGLAERGVTVVSGLARGIDGAAHRAALEADGLTVAVLACGPDDVYPPEHAPLACQIAERGALLTEFAPGTPPLSYLFPLRNRIISALCEVVVVVEARDRSGSLHTARHALEQGVEVMAVPGPIDSAVHRGSNRLLRDGAAPVLELDDVLDRLGLEGAASPAGPSPRPRLSEEAQRVWNRLTRGAATRNALAAELDGPPGAVAAGLFELELLGWARLDRDGRWRAVEPENGGS